MEETLILWFLFICFNSLNETYWVTNIQNIYYYILPLTIAALQDCPQDTFRTRNRLIFRNPIDTTDDTTDDDGVDNPLSCPHLIEREQCMPGINCFTYTWNSTEWSPCQLEKGKICGEGVQDRLLQCLRSDGRIVEVSKCEEVGDDGDLSNHIEMNYHIIFLVNDLLLFTLQIF